MNTAFHSLRAPRALMACLAVAGSLLLAACGGGGGGGAATSAPTGSAAPATAGVAVGPITGFGSVIVNGVEFDDGAARIGDDDGNALASSQLKLGMMVEVKGSVDVAAKLGKATDITVSSQLQGAVESVDAPNNSFTVLGVKVVVNQNTAYEGLASLADLKVGDFVEVHGTFDATARTLTATRVEKEQPFTGTFKVRVAGIVSNLDTKAMTFTLGNRKVDYSQAKLVDLPNGLSNGAFVRVKGTVTIPPNFNPATDALNLVIQATQVKGREGEMMGGQFALIRGTVTDFVSVANFKVDGIAVDGSKADILPPGGSASLANGVSVIVLGTPSNGTILASRIVVLPDVNTIAQQIEVKGTITQFTSAANFVVRGVTVDASGSAVVFTGGTAADLAVGRKVEVKGVLSASAGGSILKASAVRFE
jgi:hypothetical protein